MCIHDKPIQKELPITSCGAERFNLALEGACKYCWWSFDSHLKGGGGREGKAEEGEREGRLYFSTPLMEELHFGTFEPASLEECDESRPLEKK